MKVAHFSDGDNYGALGAAYELHKKMLDQGIESRFFLRIKSREDACIEEISDNTVLYRLRQLIHTIYFDRNRTDTTMFFSYNRLGIELTEDQGRQMMEEELLAEQNMPENNEDEEDMDLDDIETDELFNELLEDDDLAADNLLEDLDLDSDSEIDS